MRFGISGTSSSFGAQQAVGASAVVGMGFQDLLCGSKRTSTDLLEDESLSETHTPMANATAPAAAHAARATASPRVDMRSTGVHNEYCNVNTHELFRRTGRLTATAERVLGHFSHFAETCDVLSAHLSRRTPS
jgi:hypothetical protein